MQRTASVGSRSDPLFEPALKMSKGEAVAASVMRRMFSCRGMRLHKVHEHTMNYTEQ